MWCLLFIINGYECWNVCIKTKEGNKLTTQPFLIYPENQAYIQKQIPLPAQVPKPRSLVAMAVLILILIAISVGLVIASNNMEQENELFQNSESTMATIIGKRTSYASRGGTRYHISYRYTVDNQTYHDSSTVNRSVYDRYTVEDPIKIIYAVEKPSSTRISGVNGDKNVAVARIFAGIVGLGALYAIYVFIKQRRHAHLLKSDATVLMGTLTNVQNLESKGVHRMRLDVKFRNPYLSQWVEGHRVYMIEPNAPRPEKGSPVAIYYHNDEVWEVL
jgi:hypothetical protein